MKEKNLATGKTKKDKVTVVITLPRGVDVVLLDRLGVDDVIGQKQLSKTDVPVKVVVSREENNRLRQYPHALIVKKI